MKGVNALFLCLIMAMAFFAGLSLSHAPAYAIGTTTMSVINAVTGSSVTLAGLHGSFSINITIANVANMYGYDYCLAWNASILNCTMGFFNKTTRQWQWTNPDINGSTPPAVLQPIWEYPDTIMISKNGIANYTNGVTSLGDVSATGNFTVATLNFTVIGAGETPLTLVDADIGDPNAHNIPCTPISGLFKIATFDAAVVGVVPVSSIILQNESVAVNVSVLNKGNAPASFPVSAYYNSTSGSVGLIGTQNVKNLGESAYETLVFTWNTTGVSVGNYTIFANATAVPGDNFISDKKFVDGVVQVSGLARHDMALTGFGVNATALVEGEVAGLAITVKNQGYGLEDNCTLRVYVNNSLSVNTTLPGIFAGSTFRYLFNWSSAGKLGHYDFVANVSLKAGEVTANSTDNHGALVLTVAQAPVANFTVSTTEPTVFQEVTFNASASHDPDGVITNYTWNFGDSTYLGHGAHCEHRYTKPGNYTVQLIITDSNGLTYSATRPLTYSCLAEQNITVKHGPAPVVSGNTLIYAAIVIIIVEIVSLAYVAIRRRPAKR